MLKKILAALIVVAAGGCTQILGDFQDVCEAATSHVIECGAVVDCNFSANNCNTACKDCVLGCIALADCKDVVAIAKNQPPSERFNLCTARCFNAQ